MRASRRRGASVLVATLLLGVATVVLASVPPRPFRSVVTLVHALGLRVATDWVAVVALLSLAERVATGEDAITRRRVKRLTVAVFVAAAAIEVSPLIRLVVEPSSVTGTVLIRGTGSAVQEAAFAAGLFLATAVGGAVVLDRLGDRASGGLPVAPTEGVRPRVGVETVVAVCRVLAVVALCWFAVELATRLVFGVPYFWLAVTDSALAALGGAVEYAVLAVAFLALAVDGATVRSLVGGTAVVWVVLALLGIAVAVLSAAFGVLLVGATATPMGAVENAGMGLWPEPESWTNLLATGTVLAGGAGLSIIQRTVPDDQSPATTAAVEDSRTAR